MSLNDESLDDEWAREQAAEEADRLRKSEPQPKLSTDEFLAWRSPKVVHENPTRLDNPLWHWLVRTHWDAYRANELYTGPSAFEAGPMWVFDRFGMSETQLPDRQIVHIGGEHEDSYDPDFFIYNDVTVIGPDGNISIYGYPVDAFPPTDFHSSTLVGNEIFIIGRLGYPDGRVFGATPVYRLHLASMKIQSVETRGECPGWIYKHSATLANDGKSIIIHGGERWRGNEHATIENIDSWEFDTQSGQWLRLTSRRWQQWVMRRIDRKPNRLWDIRQELWSREHKHLGFQSYWKFGDEPDFHSLSLLYRFDESSPPPSKGVEFNVYQVEIDGLNVRFKEDRFWIEAIVEGELAPGRSATLKETTLSLLTQLEGSPWEIETT